MTNNQIIQNFTLASKCMLKAALENLREVDAEAYRGIAHTSSAGAFFEVSCAMSVAGVMEPRVTLVYPNGERVNLAHVEFGGMES